MGFFGPAEAVAQTILRAFEDTDKLPKPLAHIFISRKECRHSSNWSWGNQLLVILKGYTDARGFQQWQEVGRSVKKGERAFYILGPMKRKLVDKDTGEEKLVVVGFKGLPVFGFEQTEGPPLTTDDPEIEKWLESLPLLDVAKEWGLSVDVFDGEGASYLGLYRRGKGIALGVKNLSTWAHEMIYRRRSRTDCNG